MTEQSKTLDWRDMTLWGDVGLLLFAAPALFLPGRLATWAQPIALALLAAGWFWRRFRLGYWLVRTPADWPLLLLFAVMLPVSIWVSPSPWRDEYSIPRGLILVWNFCLFWSVVVHSSRGSRMRGMFVAGFTGAGMLIALAGLLGTRWQDKFPGLGPLLALLPQFLAGRFAGAEEGFSPNQLAGTLLYVIPLALALSVGVLRARRWWAATGLAIVLAVTSLVFVLAQSRAGFIGMATSIAVLVLAPRRWGRWLLVGTVAVALIGFLVLPLEHLVVHVDSTTLGATGDASVSVARRAEIWNRALYAIEDFPFTGVGLGTFRRIVPQLYPLFLLPPSVDIAHAHNFFLQSALDFGLPGLVALLAIYIVALVQCNWLYMNGTAFLMAEYWALGLAAALVGQAVYSLADAVAMGSKPNFMFWWLLALVFGVTTRKV